MSTFFSTPEISLCELLPLLAVADDLSLVDPLGIDGVAVAWPCDDLSDALCEEDDDLSDELCDDDLSDGCVLEEDELPYVCALAGTANSEAAAMAINTDFIRTSFEVRGT
ncbi:MAG TPA: hypothetical protein VIR81_14495 [Myxococcales bacterium]|nr:hypothetical protein [Myxococcales bacterium]